MYGYSLIEVLIALALFSTITLGIAKYSLLNLQYTGKALIRTKICLENA